MRDEFESERDKEEAAGTFLLHRFGYLETFLIKVSQVHVLYSLTLTLNLPLHIYLSRNLFIYIYRKSISSLNLNILSPTNVSKYAQNIKSRSSHGYKQIAIHTFSNTLSYTDRQTK